MTWKSVISGKKAKKGRREDERGEKVNKRNSVATVLLVSLLLGGCAAETQRKAEPTPIVVEKKSIRETEAFKKEVSARMEELLSGEVMLTVYLDSAEDFNYVGTLEVINDGSDGARPVIFIHADRKVTESEWW